MNYRTIQRSSASELVIKELLDSIRRGDLKPGDKLPPERELTKMFGVGRSTLREATSALVLVGCLEVIQGRGTFVNQDFHLDTPFFRELGDIRAAVNIIDMIEIREILECNAVKLAARRANAQTVRRLRETVSNMKAAVDDTESFSEHDFDFHISLARATGNEMIHQMMNWIVKKLHKEYQQFMPRPLFRIDKAVSTAESIVSCVANGQEDQAAGFMQDHLSLVTTELKRIMPDLEWSRWRRRSRKKAFSGPAS